MLSWILLFLHDLKDLPLRRNASAALSSGPQLSIAWITMTAPWLISWILQSLWKLYNISCSKLSSGSQISLEPNQNLLNITYKTPCGLALDDLSSLMSLPALPASLITVQLAIQRTFSSFLTRPLHRLFPLPGKLSPPPLPSRGKASSHFSRGSFPDSTAPGVKIPMPCAHTRCIPPSPHRIVMASLLVCVPHQTLSSLRAGTMPGAPVVSPAASTVPGMW